MGNFTINYVTLPINGHMPHSYSNTILGAPSQEAAEAMFKAVMNGPETRITSVQETDDVNVVSTRLLSRLKPYGRVARSGALMLAPSRK
jgi:hypothetical protein